MSDNIIDLAARRNIRKRIIRSAPLDLEAVKSVASSVCLRPGPAETGAMFVTRILREYEAARAVGVQS